MKRICRLLSVVAMLLAFGAPVCAEIKGGSPSVTVGGVAYLFDGQEHLNVGPGVAVRVGYDVTERLGVEGAFDFITTKSRLEPKQQVTSFIYRADALLYLLPDSDFVPYLAAGVGGMRLEDSPIYGNRTSFLANAGFGAKYFIADSLALRADFRGIGTIDTYKHLNGEAMVGLNYYFGREEKKVAALQPAPPTPAPAPPAPAPAPAPAAPPAPAPVMTPPPAPAPAVEPAPAPVMEAPLSVQAEKGEIAAAPAGTIQVTGITINKDSLEIIASERIRSYNTFTLSQPSRLVIDVNDAVNILGTKRIPVHRFGITAVRLGNHPDFLRIVLDAAQGKLLPYRIEETAKGLKIIMMNP